MKRQGYAQRGGGLLPAKPVKVSLPAGTSPAGEMFQDCEVCGNTVCSMLIEVSTWLTWQCQVCGNLGYEPNDSDADWSDWSGE
jgi:hypothetical protein